MFGLNGISTLEAPHSAMAKSVQRLSVKVTSSQGEIAMPTISADTYRLSIQVAESWPIPSAPRTSARAIDVTWSLNSEVMAAMRTPPRPNKGLISKKARTTERPLAEENLLHHKDGQRRPGIRLKTDLFLLHGYFGASRVFAQATSAVNLPQGHGRR